MDQNKERLRQLYTRFIGDEATPAEVQEFWDLMKQDGIESISDLAFELYNQPAAPRKHATQWDGALARILGGDRQRTQRSRIHRIHRMQWSVAASLLLLIALGGFYFLRSDHAGMESTAGRIAAKPSDIQAPAMNHATIILSDGRTIRLDSADAGQLALQNHVALVKKDDGKLEYAAAAAPAQAGLVYNTLVNPRGSKVIDIVLSDGSLVWLNAESSLTFPVAFAGDSRKVKVTGEAYFEVSHNPSKKFFVEAKGLLTEVVGTHFNVHAYPDEADTRVTLVSGSVRVSQPDGGSKTIKPGEQAIEMPGQSIRIDPKVDVASTTAWKNEMFLFHDTNIRKIMKELSRWYDVDIRYAGEPASFDDLNFGGSMSRQQNVSELLKRLEATQSVRFKIEHKNITVIKVK